MLRIVTDGAADMPDGWQEEWQIQVLPLNIHFGERMFLQGVDLSNDDFYQLVEQSGRIPQTSQPSPHQFVEFYRRIAQPGDTILSLHVTSKLSGTYASAVAAARELVGEFNIIPFDSGCGSAALGMLSRDARLLDRKGASAQQIVESLYRVSRLVKIVLTLDQIDYARKSGRVGALQAALASALNVKPIVDLEDGVLGMKERVRTRSRALERILELLHDHFDGEPVHAAVVHARDPQCAALLRERVLGLFNTRELITTDLSIAVAANLGPGTVGLVMYPAGD
jgi:DegV family protein with EDD domain